MKIKLLVLGFLILALSFAKSAFAIAPIYQYLDRVDIGTTTGTFSEAGHLLSSWGPIEPTTHGGNWGGLASDTNSQDKLARVTWYSDLDGSQKGAWNCTPDDKLKKQDQEQSAYFRLKAHGKVADTIKMRVLDGIADDSFKVEVLNFDDEWAEVFNYTADPSPTEVWKVHEMSLKGHDIDRNANIQVKVTPLGAKWNGWCPYGQLAVDWAELWGKPEAE